MPALVALPLKFSLKAPSIGLLVGNRYALDIPADSDEASLTRLLSVLEHPMLRMPAAKVYLIPTPWTVRHQ